MKKFRTRNPE